MKTLTINGDALRQRREYLHIGRKELVEEVDGLCLNTLKNWENGTHGPRSRKSVEALITLCCRLDLPVSLVAPELVLDQVLAIYRQLRYEGDTATKDRVLEWLQSQQEEGEVGNAERDRE